MTCGDQMGVLEGSHASEPSELPSAAHSVTQDPSPRSR